MIHNSLPKNTFVFNSLALEITIDECGGSRQLELNPGVGVYVKTPQKKYSIEIACNNFKNEIKTNDNFYKNIYIRQAEKINELIKLLEFIQQSGTQNEQNLLEKMKTRISETCNESLSWADDDEAKKCNVYQFIVLGKRLKTDTFDLSDANQS